ncbi:MAG: hypothetical protein NVSMB46_04150 [Candidatus Saccharimonadales bacterium]
MAAEKPHDLTKTAPSSSKRSGGWRLTTYYTVVESYHTGASKSLKGCLSRDCSNGYDNLGTYPDDFIEKVKNEGAGRITSGQYTGKYLNWSYDIGYWLDKVPANSNGDELIAYESAAADSAALARNTTFQILDCGPDESAFSANVCHKIMHARWSITDQFTPGFGGPKHVDLYIGEENQIAFENSDNYLDIKNVELSIN